MKSRRQCSKISFGSSSQNDENAAKDWFWFVVFWAVLDFRLKFYWTYTHRNQLRETDLQPHPS